MKTRFSESELFSNDDIPLKPLLQFWNAMFVFVSYVIISSSILINPYLSGNPCVFETVIVEFADVMRFVKVVDLITLPHSLNFI